jgi:GT2 family glycosyltransferase
MRDVSLIVLAWNQWQLTRRCLETLRATDLGNARVIVVDNGSTDETADELGKVTGIRVLRLPKNVGYVRGNNVALGCVPVDHDVVLLNNDLVFTQSDWLQRLRACAYSRPEIGIVGCRLRLPQGTLLHAGTYVLPDTLWGQQIGSLEVDIGQYPGRREVEGVVFACAYLRREVLAAVGGLSLDYESYFEDTDYCLRARKSGFATVVCGDVTLVHDEHGSTRDAPEKFGRVFHASRAAFQRRWRDELSSRYEHQLLVQSILNFPSGYATSCRELLRVLDRDGVKITYRYAYGPGSPFPVREPEDCGDYRLNVFASRPEPRPNDVSLVYGQGDIFERNRGRYKIGFTMLEVDGIPREWVRQANAMDEVWVPTEFNRRAFLAGGLKRPIHVMPLGVDANYFHPGVATVKNPHGEFVFLSVFEWGERKDPALLLGAFNDTFGVDEPVRLVCKIINKDPQVNVAEEIARLRLRAHGGRISYLFNVEFPYYQLATLYRSADCFVAASRGEGWDMPLLEAMACGVPGIATDWGAHPDFFHAGVGYPLRVARLVPAVAKCPYYTGFFWAEPDQEHLRHLLRHVYEHRDEAQRRGAAAAAEVAAFWTWDLAGTRVKQRLAAIAAAGATVQRSKKVRTEAITRSWRTSSSS